MSKSERSSDADQHAIRRTRSRVIAARFHTLTVRTARSNARAMHLADQAAGSVVNAEKRAATVLEGQAEVDSARAIYLIQASKTGRVKL